MAKILLVEDDKSLREIYGVRLLAEGYDIVSAGDGEEALAMAIKEKPQLIISDVMMPKISGFDMLDILRSTTETRDIKVIMMTALSSDDQRARGEQLGADRYLVKSQVGIEDVVRTVHEVLGDSGQVAAASTDAPKPADSTTAPASTTTDDSKASDSSTAADDTAAAGSAPGNADAGPLPPQPSELKPEEPKLEESTLPQPTAPFSSPRPANLGEDIVNSSAGSAAAADPLNTPVAPEESEQIHNELQATSDPVTTQVDMADDKDMSPSVFAPAGSSTPSDNGLTPNLGTTQPEPDTTPIVPPTDEDDHKNEPPSIISGSSPLS